MLSETGLSGGNYNPRTVRSAFLIKRLRNRHLITARRGNAVLNSNILEGSGTVCEDCGGADDAVAFDDAVNELSLMTGINSLMLKFDSSAGNSNSSGVIVVSRPAPGGEVMNIPPPIDAGTAPAPVTQPDGVGPCAPASGGADASQGASPAPVLTHTIAGATILTAGE